MSIFNLASTADLAAETTRAQKAEAALAAKVSADETTLAGLVKAVAALQAAGTTPPVTIPPVTTPPVTTPPVVTPPVTTPPTTGTIAHGKDLTRDMCLPRIPLTTRSGTVNASTLGDPAKISGIHFTGKLITDVDCTLTDCQFDAPVDNQPGKKVQLVNCLVSPTSVGDWGIGPDKVSATRSVIEGNSDGVRFENMNLIECWVRVKLQSAADHNDGLQCYQSSAGGSILRCNIDANPHDSAHSDIFGNGAIFIADGSKGEYEIRDNWLTGGGYTLRLHESGTYRVTGNIIEKGKWLFGPLTTTNAVSGAFKEWSNNTLSDGSILNQQ